MTGTARSSGSIQRSGTPRVLFICHNHPRVRPGGAETYALELYDALRLSGEFEPILVTRGGSVTGPTRWVHSGTPFAPADPDGAQYFVYVDQAKYDAFTGRALDKELFTRFVREFLETYEPDIIHVQHTLFLGYDILRQLRNSHPHAPILYTLHEYLPICHRDGQMLRRATNERCLEASPRRCHECFPDISPQSFFLRKRFIQSQLALVDLFFAPSRFILERYVDWGIPRERIRFEEYGRRLTVPAEELPRSGPRTRLAYFGQLTQYKGIDVLLRAVQLAVAGGLTDVHLTIHGANLDLAPPSFRSQIAAQLDALRENVTFAGAYDHTRLPRLMAGIDWVVVPSIWWENSPLVIQEAFAHGRPVICSEGGGMGEKVRDGIDGLHFAVGDPASLATVIRRAVQTPDLWATLRGGIRPVHRMDDHVKTVTGVYRTLMAARRGTPGG